MTKGLTVGVVRPVALLLALIGSLAGTGALAQVAFTARTDTAVSASPVASVVKPLTSSTSTSDLAVVNSAAASISVLLGNGDGTFQPAATYAVGNTPVAIVSASFTSGSNLPDLAVLNQGDATITIWQNNGDGTFKSPTTNPIGAGCSQPTGLTVGLFNATGTIEAAVTCFISSSNSYVVAIMVGTGAGGLNPASVTFAVGTNPVAIGQGDFNADGNLDLAIANAGDGTLSIALGDGVNNFTVSTVPVGTLSTSATSLVLEDLNQDSITDVAVGSFVLLGNGDGTFKTATTIDTAGGVIANTADFNQDKLPDLVAVSGTSSTSGNAIILLGNGDGTFQTPALIAVAPGPVAASVGTLDSGPTFDIVTVNQSSSTVSVLRGRGNGTFQVARTANASSTQNVYSFLTTTDFNNDGLPDLAGLFSVSGAAGGVDQYLGGFSGLRQPVAVSIPSSATSPAVSMTAADFNNDGLMDMAATSGGEVAVLLANSDGTFQPEVDYSAGTDPSAILAGDFNNDGIQDIVVTDNAGSQVWLLLGKGDGTFGTPANFPAQTSPVALAAADFNGDGNLDLAVVNSQGIVGFGGLSVLMGNGAGGFQSPTTYTLMTGSSAVAAGDLNADGIVDLVVTNSGSNTVSVLLGTSSGAFNAPLTFNVGSQPNGVAISDFDVNGHADIAVLNTGWNDVSVLTGDGSGSSFVLSQSFGANGGTAMAVADIDGDGSPDIGVASADLLTLLLNQATGPVAAVSPSLISFPKTGTGLNSSPIAVTVTNSGTVALSNISVSVTGLQASEFTQTNTCGTSVDPGAFCQINVTFSPTVLGLRTATLKVSDNAFNTPQTVALSGTGADPNPAISLSPASLTFAAQDVGTTSPPQGVTLTNTGVVDVSITSITVTGTNASEFAATNNCGSTVTAGSSCTVNVTFSPAAGGSRTASLSVADNAPNSPQTVALSGTGNSPAVTLSPPSLTFGDTTVGATSGSQTITLTNTGSSLLTITTISITGAQASDFSQSNSCTATIDIGASCTFTVTFQPTAAGARSASLSIADSAVGSPQTASLTGTGIAPTTTLSPSSVAFGNVYIGATGTAQTLTFTNTSGGTVTISSIVLGGANVGDFLESNNCPANLSANASCTASVNFQPTATGSRSATVTFTSNSSSSPQTVSLTGTGLSPTLSPTSVSFGSTFLGVPSAGTVITVTNTGGASISMTSIQVTGTNPSDFINSSSTCTANLAAGANCSVTIQFQPTVAGSRSATLTFNDSAAGSPQTVSLTGTGLAPTLTVAPTAGLSFPSTYVLGTLPLPAAQIVTLSNTSGGPVAFSSITVTGTNATDFLGANACSGSLATGSSCTVSVTFNPQGTGSRTASLTVTSNATGSPVNVPLSGTGLAASLNVNTANSGTQTVSAGSTATYTVSIGGQGIGATANISCSGAPNGAQCSVPSTVTVDATTPSTFTVTVKTTSSTGATGANLQPGPFSAQPWAWAVGVLGMLVLPGTRRRPYGRISRRRWSGLMLLIAVPMVLLLASCGGSGSSSGTNPNATPAGTYTISVRATAANQPASTGNLTLVVH